MKMYLQWLPFPKKAAAQLYDLAMLSHKQLSPDEMTKFVQRSNDVLMMLTK